MNTTELAPFHEEHARLAVGLELILSAARELDSLDEAQRHERLAEVLEFLQGPLARHADAEEAVLYPFVARQLRHPSATEPMAFDHELVRELTDQLADADPDAVSRLRELLYGLHAILDAHFRKEERFYLPVVAGNGHAAEISAAMEALERGEAIAEATEDRFGPHGFPLGRGDRAKLEWAVTYAIQAPSSHNSQPWRFRAEGDSLELWADRTRALPAVDPHDRELTISCGAALFHVRAALRKVGEEPAVDLFPAAADPDLLARISLLGERSEPDLRERHLFWSMRKRRTYRARFKDEPVPDEVVAALEDAAAAEGATLVVLREDSRREALAKLVAEADRLQGGDPRFRRELASWLHPNRARSLDGMPGSAVGLNDLVSTVGPLVVRTFDWGRGRAAKDAQLALGSPLLAVLTTPHDRSEDWLAAGQALAHVLLRATTDDLAASFLNQPLEVPELRERVASLAGGGVPQLVLRLGLMRDLMPPPTPRRPVADVLG